eukprot:6981102-Pyramimonas_sp.AAC.1
MALDPAQLLTALRSAGRGSAPDLAGMRYEHLRVLLEEEDMWDLFAVVAQSYAGAELPDDIAAALHLGRLTAVK